MSARVVPTRIALPFDLRGSRVLLRPYSGDDGEQDFAAIEESRDHLRPWVTWVDNSRTVDDVLDYCIRSQVSWLLRTELALGIFDAVSGNKLGGTGLDSPDWGQPTFEIGYWLRLTATGQDYATESTRLLADLALSNLPARRVTPLCGARNEAIPRLAERAKFVLEGRLCNVVTAPDRTVRDDLVYVLIPEDHLQRWAS